MHVNSALPLSLHCCAAGAAAGAAVAEGHDHPGGDHDRAGDHDERAARVGRRVGRRRAPRGQGQHAGQGQDGAAGARASALKHLFVVVMACAHYVLDCSCMHVKSGACTSWSWQTSLRSGAAFAIAHAVLQGSIALQVQVMWVTGA